jgi:hypothetical protein
VGPDPARVMIDNTHVVVLHGTGRDMILVPEMAAFGVLPAWPADSTRRNSHDPRRTGRAGEILVRLPTPSEIPPAQRRERDFQRLIEAGRVNCGVIC